MAISTILEYLTQPNPSLDCSKSLTGTNTSNAKWDPITGLEDWKEFNYSTLMERHGDILQRRVSLPECSPALTQLEIEIVTEKSFEALLWRALMPKVSAAAKVAWVIRCPEASADDVPEISGGDRTRRGTNEADDLYYADWSMMCKNKTTPFGYRNLCPGETKLSSKWRSSGKARTRPDYLHPFKQIQTYCGRQWNVRYGFIITPEELVVVEVSREAVGPGLSVTRPVRTVPRVSRDESAHTRTLSAETLASSIQAMSLNDAGSSYNEEANLDIEYGPLRFKSIPWSAAGSGVLTVTLTLWWLLMGLDQDVSIGTFAIPSVPDLSRSTAQDKGKNKARNKK